MDGTPDEQNTAQRLKRITALHVITMGGERTSKLRAKARAFRLWQDLLQEQEAMLTQIELYRISNQLQ
jgi:hypothetical protein